MKLTFYVIRHGYSCANMQQHKKYYISQTTVKDPHLSKWGIIGSLIEGHRLKRILKNVHIDESFCSPLIRTWETAICMIPPICKNHDIFIAPYMKEKSSTITTLDNVYNSYDKNQKKLIDFNNFLKKIDNENPHNLFDSKYLNKLKIHKLEDYSKDNKYSVEGSLEKFIKWYIEDYMHNDIRNSKNILVFTHSGLIKSFIKKHKKDLIETGIFKSNNNYCISIEIMVNHPTKYYIKVVTKGFPKPSKEEIKLLTPLCTPLCKSFKLLENKCTPDVKKVNDIVYNNLLYKFLIA